MNLFLTISIALRGLLSNKMRAFLTVLGVIIGVLGIIVIVSVGNGAESLIVNQVTSIGSNLIGILPGGREEDEPPAAMFGIVITTLTNEDILAIKNIPNIVAVSGSNKSVENITYKNKSLSTTINGVSAEYPLIENYQVEFGRFFNENDDFSLGKVVVLGATINKDLFGEFDSIGQQVRIHGHNFRVIGVFAEKGSSGFSDNDSQVFIPGNTMQKLILGINHLALARAKVDKEENIDQAVYNIEAVLRSRHKTTGPGNDDFSVTSQKQGLDIVRNITGSIKLFLTAIAFIALIVGGIGIMNVMYVAVTERTHEIGLRKALGAKRADILRQFLVEAVVITSVGGIIGVILGVLISWVIAVLVRYFGYSWDFIITFDSVLYAVLIIAGTGVVFGYFPAKKASLMSAIEALRYE